MEKIFYIHGFGSTGVSETTQNLRKLLPYLITPTYDPYEPQKSLQKLDSMLRPDDQNIIIASSLGGWYAERLSELHENVSLVLYNPCINPALTLQKYGVKPGILKEYVRIQRISSASNEVPVILNLCKDDDVIDYKTSLEHYRTKESNGEVKPLIVNYLSGGHRMGDNYPQVVDSLKKLKV